MTAVATSYAPAVVRPRGATLPAPVELFGLPLHPYSMSQTLDAVERLVDAGGVHQHVVLNAAKVVAASDDPELHGIIRGCDIVNADGQSVVWAARLLGVDVPERVTGIDLMDNLLARAARR